MPEHVFKKFPYESEIYFNHIICIYVKQFRNKEINLPFNNCLQGSFHENNGYHAVVCSLTGHKV